ncbi:MAG: hypothetical protein KDB53_00100 [Planctomycetes bacterium]|nr:hypothetical protein [Planctomycetota bacterium]
MSITAKIGMVILALVLGAGAWALGRQPRQPAQDYAVTGTLQVDTRFKPQVSNFLRQNYDIRVVMSARSSPDVEDTIIQRRWIKGALPLEFGLGKKIGSDLATEHPELWLTAIVDFVAPHAKNSALTLVGWTREPVKTGSSHQSVVLTHSFGEADPNSETGFPRGGWESTSVMEEATPPGVGRFDPGPLAFGGIVDVVPESARTMLRGIPLRLVARERADRGFPELIRQFEAPVYPFRFSLHQNHRQAGGNERIRDPKYVAAFIDLDGITDTKEDEYVAVTKTKVDPETRDINLVIDVTGLMEQMKVARARMQREPSNPNPHATTEDRGDIVVRGVAHLPPGAIPPAGAVLWISLRDGATNQLALVSAPVTDATFPYAFEVREGDDTMGGGRRQFTAPVKVKLCLSATGPMATTKDGAFLVLSDSIEPGTTDIKLVLEGPE